MSVDTPVLIVGAGPVGLTLANLLGGEGIAVHLVEARDGLIDYPRAVGIDDEALRTMQTIGLVDRVLPHTVPDQKVRIVNGDRAVLAEINPTTREFGWPRRNGFVQPLVDRVLLEGLDRFPDVRVEFSTELVDLAQDADGVTATLRGADGETREVRAGYLIACEGGRSFTRQKLGLSFDGETRHTRGLVIDVADDPIGTPHAVFGGDPARGYATISLPHGIRRWEFTMLADEPESLADDDDFVFGLLAGHVPDPRALNIIRRRVYAHHARVASGFQRGRVILAGDAAHVMPVVAGQGWNSGIRDAVNLGWKLALAIRGDAAPALLETYEEERRAHVTAMVALSLNMANLVTDRNKVRTAIRDTAAKVVDRMPKLKAKVSSQGFKPMPQYDSGVVVPSRIPDLKTLPAREGELSVVGRIFPQPWVRTAGDPAPQRLDDATGQGWRVIVWNNDPEALLSEESRARIAALGGTCVHVVPAEQLPWATREERPGVVVVGDHTGEFKAWFDRRPFSTFVVRPDHVVAGEALAQDLESTWRAVLSAAHIRDSQNYA